MVQNGLGRNIGVVESVTDNMWHPLQFGPIHIIGTLCTEQQAVTLRQRENAVKRNGIYCGRSKNMLQ